MYATGQGVPKDAGEALKWAKQSVQFPESDPLLIQEVNWGVISDIIGEDIVISALQGKLPISDYFILKPNLRYVYEPNLRS